MTARYGLLGEHLGHSFSKLIHEQLADYTYDLIELAPDALAPFLQQKEFAALNVTIPYKEAVIPYLDEVDERAAAIGAVNTIVNRDGRLTGYNTDFDGVAALLEHNGVQPAGKTCLVLGTGGTCKTVSAVLRSLGAAQVLVASRSGKNGALTYPQAARRADVQLVFNTTPCGMYPNGDNAPIDLSAFPKLEAVLDAIYNPLRTRLVQQGTQLGAASAGGLYMLVAQAVAACEKFLDRPLAADSTRRIYRSMTAQKQNIVLIGMPGCGKSTVGRLLAKQTGRQLVDLDAQVTQLAGKSIPRIFEEDGEPAFRDLETQAARQVGEQTGLIIATGGGTVLRDENVAALRQNGWLVFLDRPLAQLQTGNGRPLSADFEALAQRYTERYPRYCATADWKLMPPTNSTASAALVKEKFDEIFSDERT